MQCAGTAVGLIGADGELDGRHPERLSRRCDRTPVDAVDPGRPEVGDPTVGPIGDDATADAVPGLEHDDFASVLRQQPGGGET